MIAEQEYYAALAERYRGVDSALPRDLDIFQAVESACRADDPAEWTLDLGCGTGRYFHVLKNTRRILGLDLTPAMLRQARDPIGAEQIQAESLHLVCGSAYGLPIENRSIDRVVAIGVLAEHVALDLLTLNEIARVLRPGGRFVLTIRSAPRRSVPTQLRRALARAIFPLLTDRLRKRLRRRLYLAPHGHEAKELQRQLGRAGFHTETWHPIQQDEYPHTFALAVREG